MFTHIKHNLPEITKEIRRRHEMSKRDSELGSTLPNRAKQKDASPLNMITDFVTIYKNTITGKFDSKRYSNNNPAGKENYPVVLK